MGLDNGICVKRTPAAEKIPELKAFEEEWCRCNFEICYWRKCWNIRSRIFDVLRGPCVDGWRIFLSVEDIDRIAEVLQSFTEENWEDEGGSIWAFSEMEDRLKQQIENLGVLKRLMQEHELGVYFYDSY